MLAKPTWGQVKRPFSVEGTVKKLSRGSLVMTDRAGRTWQLRFAGSDGVVTLGNNRKFRARPLSVDVAGTLGKADLREGMEVQFECYMTDKGRVRAPVTEIRWLDEAKFKQGIKQNKKKKNDQGDILSQVSATVERVDARGFRLRVRSRLTKKGVLAAPLDEAVKLTVKSRDLGRVREGDAITEAQGVELVTGDFVLQKLAVRLMAKSSSSTSAESRRRKKEDSSATIADAKYASLSDEAVSPRVVRDAFLPLKTDLSDQKSRILQDELTEVLRLLTTCFGRKPTAPIQIQAIADEQRWPAELLSEDLRQLVKQGECKVVRDPRANGSRRGAVTIYAPAKTSLIRATLATAYLQQIFGSAGPEWYQEGMSEVAKYWKPPANEVQIGSTQLKMFSRAKGSKSATDIVSFVAPESEEDISTLTAAEKRRRVSFQARQTRERQGYRWALCFMLANNPNYRKRFQQYSAKMLTGREISFDDAFGKVSKQLDFEFAQFTTNVENGYRMDLAAWRWAHRFRELGKSEKHKETIQSKLGWQPLVLVEEGSSYDIVAQGEWTIDGTGKQTTGDGDDAGVGKLIAAVLNDEYQLSKAIPIGRSASFKAPAKGRLYVRCGEKWSGLADNSGKLVVHIRHSK